MIPVNLICTTMIAAFVLSIESFACNELKSRPVELAVVGYLDSTRLAKNLKKESPFKGLYEMQKKNFREDSILDCDIGKSSVKYAKLLGGRFSRITSKDIAIAKGKPVDWNDLNVFLDLGEKIRTPGSIAELKNALDKDSIKVDKVFPSKREIQKHAWFGVFYKETYRKAFIYGVEFKNRNDTLVYSSHEPYFAFAKSDFANNYLDGASALYIMDTTAYYNTQKLKAFIEKVHE